MTAERFPRRRVRPLPILASLVALAAALAACAGCTEKLVAPPPPPTVLGVPDSIQQIFTAHCALSGCHTGSAPIQGMSLADARTSWLAIVDVPANELAGQYRRIAPGDSANSYLVMKLRDDPRIQGLPMPAGDFPLDSASVMAVALWAQAGAPGQALPAARTGIVASRGIVTGRD
jgi:hypothetical protein